MNTISRQLLSMFIVTALSGCATARNPVDPLEPFNRGVYQFNDVVDKAVLKPVAQGYKAVIPSFVQTGVRNFFSNVNDIWVVANDLLQLKINQAAEDSTRFLMNSTIGVLGLIDMATPSGLEKHNEDFGQTLGVWGIESGPYLVLPVFGPSTFRDTVGLIVDFKEDPLTNSIGYVPTRNTTEGLRLISKRADILDGERIFDDASLDRYSFLRDAYLQRRRSLIYDGNPPPEVDDGLNGTSSPSKPSGNETPEAPAVSPRSESVPEKSLIDTTNTADIEKAYGSTQNFDASPINTHGINDANNSDITDISNPSDASKNISEPASPITVSDNSTLVPSNP